jgi:acetyl-CoA acetyltransferase
MIIHREDCLAADIAIVGIAETAPARALPFSAGEAVLRCVLSALDDAGIDPSEVDGIVTDTGIMPVTVPHDEIAGQLNIECDYSASISYGGAGIMCAPMLARDAINSGRANVVISYFGVDWGKNPDAAYHFHDRYPAKLAFEKPHGYIAQPLYFAHLAQRYRHEFGLSDEELASVAISHREYAVLKGNAQAKSPLTFDGYLNSRMIASPLRAADCCQISDGAGAFVMTSAARAKDCKKPPVFVKGVGFAASSMTGDAAFTQNPDYLSMPGATRASLSAQRDAGIDISEVDFAEIYDCFTISCILELEDIGFCPKGEGARFFAEGRTRLGGSLPVNTHGGLLSYSYRLGIEHLVEAVRQLRGEGGATQVANAEIGLVSGLSVPDYGVLLLGAEHTGSVRNG